MTEQQAPGPWELRRAIDQIRDDQREGFASINSRLDRLVSADAFAAEQRRMDEKIAGERQRTDEKIAALTDDLTKEAAARKEGDQAQQSALDKLVANQKWIVVAIGLPVALFLANLFLQKG